MNEYERLRRQAIVLRDMYPPGTRVECLCMNDPFAPVPSGTKGTVFHVDDMAQIHVNWDITMPCLSATIQQVNPGTITSEEHYRRVHSRETYQAAYPNTAFTGTASRTKYFCLRHLSICCRLFLCTKRIGMTTAMRHPAPFRTGCFFNVSRTIQTSKRYIFVLITIAGDSRLISG